MTNQSPPRFQASTDVASALRGVGYIASDELATTVFVAGRLNKPLLIEGPAGVGKTELAKSYAQATGMPLIRLQCYEGLDEAKALYEWNYRKQLLRIQADEGRDATWQEIESSIFDEDFLLERPLLRAIKSPEPAVLLIDEVDRTEFEFEAFLLELLAEFQVTVPELGTLSAVHHPTVFLTSNATRELSEALKRRCLYMYADYPDEEREREIILSRVPDLPEVIVNRMVEVLAAVRELELKKRPSISESIDWARTILTLGIQDLDETAIRSTLNVVLKNRPDLQSVAERLKLDL